MMTEENQPNDPTPECPPEQGPAPSSPEAPAPDPEAVKRERFAQLRQTMFDKLAAIFDGCQEPDELDAVAIVSCRHALDVDLYYATKPQSYPCLLGGVDMLKAEILAKWMQSRARQAVDQKIREEQAKQDAAPKTEAT